MLILKNYISRTIFIVVVCVMVALSGAPGALASHPTVRNYPRTVYSWGSQNWASDEDSEGMMYFGNKYGLLTFDGIRWRNYTLPNFSTVRAVMADSKLGRVYVAGSEEFGYFTFDSGRRLMHYESLSSGFPNIPTSYGEIWKIYEGENTIWFQGDHAIFAYNPKGEHFVASIREKINTSAYINGVFYAALSDKGFCQLRDGQFIPLDSRGILDGKRIVAICPFGNEVLIVTQFDGFYLYGTTGLRTMPTILDDFLREAQAFCADTQGSEVAVGTVNGGLVVCNFSSSAPPTYSNTDSGLQNNTVLSVKFDSHHNIWCGLDNGIDYVCYDAPFRSIFSRSGSCGAGYASLLSNGTLYLGTNQGLYTTPFRSDFNLDTPRRLIPGQVWHIVNLGGSVAACTDAGLFIDNGSGFRPVENVAGTWDARILPSDSRYALASTYDNFILLEDVNGQWTNLGRIAGFSDINGSFTIDKEGAIWICHWLKGVYRLHLDLPRRRFDEVDFFDSSRGLPTNENTSVALHEGQPVISCSRGYYHLEDEGSTNEHLAPHPGLNTYFQSQVSPHIYHSPGGEVWSVTPDNVYVMRARADGSHAVDSITFSPMSSYIIPGFDSFNFVDESRVIASAQDGFYELDTRRAFNAPRSTSRHGALVSAIYANQDSLIYLAFGAADSPVPPISNDLNSLRFEFAAPGHSAEAKQMVFSHYLENYDNDWSSYSDATSKEYTQLHEGDYTLHLRAYNSATHSIDEHGIKFSILPPWYRSPWAKVVYTILTLLLFYTGFRVVTYISERNSLAVARRKEEEMEHLRARAAEESLRKENEISDLKNQQLEQDIRHKAGELSNITMNVVRKNEILMNISTRLTKIQRTLEVSSPAETNAQLSKIQALIQENISHDDDWKTFTGNFDAVYEDFTKRLRELHPSLTPAELRVCCYIRMGLSSKDMAPLFNISYRSVEMTRYRLRKKLNLDREDKLPDYLNSL
ncbi:MAG: hypothetical protein K2M06_05130 [Muribaculaceae bacterium]|nr:hypothetical protein [Muribaculaceae bacterium]